ncbi:MAG TPA: FAD:protein FMN transferase [Salinivirgaceae bacterium]|nr:FAD:protein FMN transferase [Salinivirgaceae bacterium]
MGKNLIVTILAFFLVSCGKRPTTQWQFNKGRAHGTFYSVAYEYSYDLQSSIDSVTSSIDQSLSTFLKESIISRINDGDTTVILDSQFIEVFDKAKIIWQNTYGAFDITVAPLVNAWGFGYAPEKSVSQQKIDSIKQWVGMEKVSRAGNRLILSQRGIKLDASAIAKGYSVDRVAHFFETKGINNYMVEIGGEVRVKGKNSHNKPWRIGIEAPIESTMISEQRELESIVNITGGAIATSGNYRQFYYKDGKKYAHTIDPKSGYPVQHQLLSATVYADDCMTADAYATAFMVLGLEKSYELATQLNGIEAYFIFTDSTNLIKTKMTTGFTRFLNAEDLPKLQ